MSGDILKISQSIVAANTVANALGVSKGTLRNYNEIGILPSMKIGGRIMYKVKDVEDFINGKTQKQ